MIGTDPSAFTVSIDEPDDVATDLTGGGATRTLRRTVTVKAPKDAEWFEVAEATGWKVGDILPHLLGDYTLLGTCTGRLAPGLWSVRLTFGGEGIGKSTKPAPPPTPPPALIDDLPLWTSRTLEWIGPHHKAGDWTRGSPPLPRPPCPPRPRGAVTPLNPEWPEPRDGKPREYKSYTLAPRVPWLRVAILSGLASAAILYAMRLNGWL